MADGNKKSAPPKQPKISASREKASTLFRYMRKKFSLSQLENQFKIDVICFMTFRFDNKEALRFIKLVKQKEPVIAEKVNKIYKGKL